MSSPNPRIRFLSTGSAFALLVVTATLGFSAATFTSVRANEPEAAESEVPVQIDAKALATMIQSFDKVEEHKFSWGWIRWLMNSKLDPKAQMTLGIVELKAGQTNPLHIHANCEEQLYVLSGSCEHQLGDKMAVLKKGDLIRIPAGVAHKARTFEKESMRALIVYSSGERQFEIVDPAKKGQGE